MQWLHKCAFSNVGCIAQNISTAAHLKLMALITKKCQQNQLSLHPTLLWVGFIPSPNPCKFCWINEFQLWMHRWMCVIFGEMTKQWILNNQQQWLLWLIQCPDKMHLNVMFKPTLEIMAGHLHKLQDRENGLQHPQFKQFLCVHEWKNVMRSAFGKLLKLSPHDFVCKTCGLTWLLKALSAICWNWNTVSCVWVALWDTLFVDAAGWTSGLSWCFHCPPPVQLMMHFVNLHSLIHAPRNCMRITTRCAFCENELVPLCEQCVCLCWLSHRWATSKIMFLTNTLGSHCTVTEKEMQVWQCSFLKLWLWMGEQGLNSEKTAQCCQADSCFPFQKHFCLHFSGSRFPALGLSGLPLTPAPDDCTIGHDDGSKSVSA